MKGRWIRFISLVIALYVVQSVSAQDLDKRIYAEMEKRHIPGAAIAVVRNGKVIFAKGYGLADIEQSISSTPDRPFPIGSVSKQFTATAIMMLLEEGKLSLDNKAETYLPNLPSAYSEITVRHLLTHTSGIQRDFKVMGQSLIGENLYNALAKAPLSFKPGEKTSYSNTNFVLLGLIIEAVSKKSYGEFITERIFKPLGMTSTTYFLPGENVEKRAAGYEWEKNAYHKLVRIPARFGAGAIISTVVDMAKWDAALYTEKLIKKSTLAQMWNPTRLNNGKTAAMGYDYAARQLNVGMGWFISDYLGHKVIHHGGAIDGFSSQIDRYVNDKLTVIVLCNNENAPAAALAKIVGDNYVPNLDRKRITSLNQQFLFAYQQGQHAEAIKFNLLAIEKGDKNPITFYNTACSFSLLGDKDKAFSYLERAIELNFSDLDLLKRDTDFKPLRDDPRWLPVVEKISARLKK